MSGLTILGVMTGTSCDGLDASLVEFDLEGWRPRRHFELPYPQRLKKRVLELQVPKSRWSTREFLELHRDLGLWYADAIQEIQTHLAPQERPGAVGLHGQTVAHFPPNGPSGHFQKAIGITSQLGDPALVAHLTGLTVVSDFRRGDLAAGGQGAPLVPFYHRILAQQLTETVSGCAIHNIGGVSNCTFFTQNKEIIAFDTGPGNFWIDYAASKASGGKRQMDKDGKLAAQGEVDSKAVSRILNHKYFKKPWPKSTGRDEFPAQLLTKATRAKGADLVATATAVTVESIARAYELMSQKSQTPLRKIWVCGGGARNPVLMRGLQARLASAEVSSLQAWGWETQAIESQAFAYFAFMSLQGLSYSGHWTGARAEPILPGQIQPGKNWLKVQQTVLEIVRVQNATQS